MTQYLFHITDEDYWRKGSEREPYQAESLASEGFIHCSSESQVFETAARLFRGRSDLIVLIVDSDRLGAPIVWENLEGGEMLFPHVYGPIPRSAVHDVRRIREDAGGFQWSEEVRE